MTIRAIYFDIGGVLMRTEDRTPRQKLAQRLGLSAEELETLVFGGEAGIRAQLGQVSEAEQWAYACRQAGWPVERVSEFREQFFGGDRLDRDLLDFIRSLRRRYRTGVISNAMDGTRALIEGAWGMADAFDTLVLSAEVGVMKPDPRIFQLALQRLNVLPAQALFIDDFQHNIDGARLLGMHAIRFHTPAQVCADICAALAGDKA
jgi:epoxide hydrolase-like predicted phosphatase